METVTLELTKEEAVDVLNVLGSLPTSSNAWPLLQKIAGQVKAQETTSDDAEEQKEAA